MSESSPNPALNHPPTIRVWCLYDFANSAFTTLIVTFVYGTYFSQAFAENEATGTALWSRAVAISSVLIALLSPMLGAMADKGGARRRYLIISTLVCVAATTTLTFVTPDQNRGVIMALTIFVVANVAFEVGLVFYNAFLPIITTPDRLGRISGYGWGLGYAGGLLALVLGLVLLIGVGDMLSPLLPLSTENGFNVRATNLLVAGWFLLFSIPTFMFLRDPGPPSKGINFSAAFRELGNTFRRVSEHRQIVRFLIARLIYNDGLVTVIAFGGIYAAGTFGFTLTEVMIFGIILNVAAGLGAWGFGIIDDRVGGKATIMTSLVALAVATSVAVFATNRMWFWVAGFLMGIFMGPNQSASRSLMARFVPQKHQAEFFGFFAFSGKATAFMGPLLLGILAEAFNSQRVGVSVVLLFFLVGGILLARVDEREGIAAGG